MTSSLNFCELLLPLSNLLEQLAQNNRNIRGKQGTSVHYSINAFLHNTEFRTFCNLAISWFHYRALSHEVTAAILVTLNNEMAPSCCSKLVLWESNFFSFASKHLHWCWPSEWNRAAFHLKACVHTNTLGSVSLQFNVWTKKTFYWQDLALQSNLY